MNVLFVGGGNMGRALAGGLLAEGAPPESVRILEIDANARARIRREFGVTVNEQIDSDAVDWAKLIVLAVKPQGLRATAAALKPFLGAQLVVSIAAGIRIADLSRWLGGYTRIVRAMPNTPALIRRGITGLFAEAPVTEVERAQAATVLAAVGQTLWCEREQQLDAITAVSGSGPAYLFHFLESTIAAAESLGFSADQARRLAYATASGAIALAEQSTESPAVLREQVTSKGGTTAAALAVLNDRGVRDAYVAAIRAADARAAEMGDLFGRDD